MQFNYFPWKQFAGVSVSDWWFGRLQRGGLEATAGCLGHSAFSVPAWGKGVTWAEAEELSPEIVGREPQLKEKGPRLKRLSPGQRD